MFVPRTRGASGMKPKEKSAFDAQAFLNRSEHGEGLRSSEENKSSSLKVRLRARGQRGR